MFTWINSQGVRSDRGFEVECMDRFQDEYREAGKKVTLDVERCFFDGKAHISIFPTAFERWDGDPERVILPVEKQNEMLANYIDAMEFQGVAVVVEEGE